ncbi:uncharacterized protein LOC132280869 [Cornus florida]|uniref:uncharacterized protein LOC132280869 n=1 Tax=Cornus florida TaxID=4283 RepID=UPI00289EC9E2|nr:uncharacterized protein LOC132280869 [Cornus florida]
MDVNDENMVPLDDLTDITDDGKVVWDDSHIENFIILIEEKVRLGNHTSGTFNTIGWKNLVEGMRLQTGKNFTKNQLRNKFNQLRADYKDLAKLLSKIGVGYNAKTCMVILEPERWDRLIKVSSES